MDLLYLRIKTFNVSVSNMVIFFQVSITAKCRFSILATSMTGLRRELVTEKYQRLKMTLASSFSGDEGFFHTNPFIHGLHRFTRIFLFINFLWN